MPNYHAWPGPHCASVSLPRSHDARQVRYRANHRGRPPRTHKAGQSHIQARPAHAGGEPAATRRLRNHMAPCTSKRRTRNCQALARRTWRTLHNPPRRCHTENVRARRLKCASRGSEGTRRTLNGTPNIRRCNASKRRRNVCLGGQRVISIGNSRCGGEIRISPEIIQFLGRGGPGVPKRGAPSRNVVNTLARSGPPSRPTSPQIWPELVQLWPAAKIRRI